jgi:HD-GYP domain-containing protein (c-di-GMP phosphodiesterase class II)
MVSLRDVSEVRGPFLPFSLLEKESFVAYFGVPLVARGQVKGVLEIFHRSRLEPEPDWLQFLEALATDVAIAIDNAALFDDLQRANTELTLAYDATLEGWGRALELRDEVTEGHTQRVTKMTVRLAQAMEVSEAELVHIRRGSFLHDIGKIGIPDAILLKTDALTEEEWRVMRMHPVYAFRLLQPVRYLRPALDIPYCHHERWDGAGYPRGLSGEHIPLAARIFAVVDVWDALRSKRAYHPEWPEERVREHLRSLAGSQLDPAAVEAFLAIDW